jgi:hypothetical protein
VGGRRWVLAAATVTILAATTTGATQAVEPPVADRTDLAAPDFVQISVLNYRHWIDDGYLYIVGEVRNTSAYRVDGDVRMTITPGRLNMTETLIKNFEIGSLAPGGRSPFVLASGPSFPNSPPLSVLSSSAGGQPGPNPSGAVGVSSAGGFSSDPGLAAGAGDMVRAEVRNGTNRPIAILAIIAAFRGSDGKISNVGFSPYGEPVVVQPGDSFEEWVRSSGPSGKLAVSADIDIRARFADGAQEPVVSWQNWFQDIDASSLKASIAWLAEQGITTGCAPFRFCPNASVTRAQMALFLDRAFDLPSATIDYFDDDDGKTGEASINALAKAGITGGCGTRRFCPTANVTRAQMALFLDRAIEPPLPRATTDYFDDDDGKTGEGAINALAKAGITGGCGTRRYCPAAFVTRAQMAAFLKRALD